MSDYVSDQSYSVKVVGPIRYSERKDGDNFKVAHYLVSGDDMPRLLVDLAGGGYDSKQVAKPGFVEVKF